jgi:hypothetical protein
VALALAVLLLPAAGLLLNPAAASAAISSQAGPASSLAWSTGATPLRADTGLALNDVSCPGANLCVALNVSEHGGGAVFTSTDPAAGAGSWNQRTLNLMDHESGVLLGFTALSCPTTSLCVASDWLGNIWVATNPSGGASAWHKEPVAGSEQAPLVGVACPSATVCVANDASGDVWVSTDPASGAGSWHKSTTLKGKDGPVQGFGPVQCSSTKFCWSTVVNGNYYPAKSAQVVHVAKQTWSTIAPLTGRWASTTASVPATAPLNVSCATSSLCVQVSGGAVATGPSSSGPWQSTPLIGWTPAATGVACPTLGGCVAVDQGGNVLQIASESAAGSGTAPTVTWSATAIPDISFTGGVSCPTSSFCLAGESGGAVAVATGPTAPATSWQSLTLSAAKGTQIDSVSCPSAELCIAATSKGAVLASSTPTVAASWHVMYTLPPTGDSGNPLIPQPLTFTSCASINLCFTGGPSNIDGEDDDSSDSGMLLVSTNPAKSGSWSGYRVGLAGISCPAANLCFGLQEVGAQGAALIYSRNPKAGLATWKSLTGKAANASTALGGTFPKGAPGAPALGGFEVNANLQPYGSLTGGSSIACASLQLCVAVGQSSTKKTATGVVIASTTPTVASSWRSEKLSSSPLVGVSCSQAGQCVAYSASGQLFLTTASSS